MNKEEIKIVDAETEKLNTKYCIPDWLRAEQIRINCKRYTNRFVPNKGLINEPVALVCFGPSLNDTWEELKKFKYIISCSGSHKFLVDRNIIPTWHVEVDPRSHKIQLIGDKINWETTFLMASCVHPNVLEHLCKLNANFSLWHTYSGEHESVIPNIFPKGEWVITGGANVGLRALTLARMLGFTDIHIFGMDGSFDKDSKIKHAAEHPNTPKSYILAKYDNELYATTNAFLECARGTFHELAMLSDVKARFYGDGLIQRMAIKKTKDSSVKIKDKSELGFYPEHTISAEYIEQNQILHDSNAFYGISVLKYIDIVKQLYETTKSKSLLDYGCGKGMLAKNLDFPIWEYDPAIIGKDSPPKAADLVVCIDVLEHIEPEYIDYVLKDIARCTKKLAYFIISTAPSLKVLPDGRNTHLIQENKEWWENMLSKYFIIPKNAIKESKFDLHIIVTRDKLQKNRHSFMVSKEEVAT